MDIKEGSSTSFMCDDLLEIISAFLREGKSTIHVKLYKRGVIFLSLPNFPHRMENRGL